VKLAGESVDQVRREEWNAQGQVEDEWRQVGQGDALVAAQGARAPARLALMGEPLKLRPFVTLARRNRKHRDGTPAAIRLGLTNARLEGSTRRCG
jgi:hypothetical protein